MPVSPILGKSNDASLMSRSPALNANNSNIHNLAQNMKSAVVGLTNTPKMSRRNSNISNLSYISGLSKSGTNVSAAMKAKMA